MFGLATTVPEMLLQLSQQVLVVIFQKYPFWQVQLALGEVGKAGLVSDTAEQLKSQLKEVAFQTYPVAQLQAVPAALVTLSELGTNEQFNTQETLLVVATNENLGLQGQTPPDEVEPLTALATAEQLRVHEWLARVQT